MTTAFVLPGGASLGACQAGMMQALSEADIRPDLLIGTSAGAMNAAYLGLHPGPAGIVGLTRLWSSFRRRKLVRLHPVHASFALAGYHPALFDRSGMEAILRREIGTARLEQLPLPVAVMATDALTGKPVLLREGPALTAVMASSAMPGVFPPISWDGRSLIDGSVAADAPVAEAQRLGADEIWVLTTSSRPNRPLKGALQIAVHAFSLVSGTVTAAEVAQVRRKANVHVLPSPVVNGPGVFDFSHSADLIDEAHRTTATWLRDHPRGAEDLTLPEETPAEVPPVPVAVNLA